MMRKSKKIIQIMQIALFLFITAEGSAVEVSGYLKSFGIHNEANHFGESGVSWENALRIRITERFHENVNGELVYAVHPNIRRGTAEEDPISRPSALSYRVEDIDKALGKLGRDAPVLQNLDRLNVSITMPSADISIGRQVISFGKARVISPTDMISPFSFDTLDQEERVGVDAVRAVVPLGELSDIDMGYILGRHFSIQQSAAFLKGNLNLSGNDVTATAIYFRKNVLLGLGVQGTLWKAGMWAEAAYTFTNSFEEDVRENDYFRFSTGVDYNFTENVYAFAEYHYNQVGASTSKPPSQHLSQVAYTQGSVYLLKRHYFIPGVAWQANPLLSIRAELLSNFDVPSCFASLLAEYSLADDTYLDMGFFQAFGAPSSEFQQYHNRYFLSLRHYF